MAERANFIHIKNGDTQVFSNRWGAGDIWKLALSGADNAISYMHNQDKDDCLWDDDWSQGALLINEDKKEMVASIEFWHFLYGDLYLDEDSYFSIIKSFLNNNILNMYFLDMMKANWEGWKVKLAKQSAFAVQDNICVEFDAIPAIAKPTKLEEAHFIFTKQEVYERIALFFLIYDDLLPYHSSIAFKMQELFNSTLRNNTLTFLDKLNVARETFSFSKKVMRKINIIENMALKLDF